VSLHYKSPVPFSKLLVLHILCVMNDSFNTIFLMGLPCMWNSCVNNLEKLKKNCAQTEENMYNKRGLDNNTLKPKKKSTMSIFMNRCGQPYSLCQVAVLLS
jgi:hypothetical protein